MAPSKPRIAPVYFAGMTRSSSTSAATPRAQQKSAPRGAWPALGVLIMALSAWLVYSRALSGDFILDDDLLVQNQLIKDPQGLYRIWLTTDAIDYWPVSNSTLWLEWRLWGMNPTGYHVTNLLLHLLTAVAIWVLLRQLSVPGAYLVALLFVVHPVNVESVAWISQRKTILAALFFWLSLLAYVKADPAFSEQRGFPRGPWYALSLLTFVLGMLSKASIATLPFILLLVVWWKRGRLTKQDLVRVAPFLLALVPLVLVNLWFRTHGTSTVFRSAGLLERLAAAGAIPWFYLSKALWPLQLAFIYPLWDIQTGNVLWWLPLLAAGAVTGGLWWVRETPLGRPLFFAWAFYWLALAPVLGFADVSYMKWSLVADHYQYLALVAVVAVVIAAGSGVQRRLPNSARGLLPAAAALVVLALLLLARQQSLLYQDEVALYRDTIENNPHAWMAMNNLGNALVNRNQPKAALDQLNQGIELNPRYAPAYYNRANALVQLGQALPAIEDFRRAFEIEPDFAAAHYNLGNVLLALGRTPEAVTELAQAVTSNPDSPEYRNNLASALRQAGRLPEAINQLEQAVRIEPDYTEAWANLAATADAAQRTAEARAAGEQALRLARQQGKTALAAELEAWLTTYPTSAP